MTEEQTPSPRLPPEGGRLRERLIKSASGNAVILAAFAGISFLNNLVLANFLGADGFGAYSGALAWMSLLLIPAVMGFDTLLVRDVAIYKSQQKLAQLKGLLRFSAGTAVVTSILCAAFLVSFAYWGLSSPEKQPMRDAVYIAAFLLPISVLATIAASALRGLEKVILSNLPGLVFRPTLILLGVLLVFFLWPERLSAPVAMMINVVAAFIALMICLIWLRKNTPAHINNVQAEYKVKPWIMAALPMLLYSGSQTIMGQTDTAMLGVMRDMEETGIYAAANRLSYLLIFFMSAISMVLAPMVARLYEAGEKERLQNIISKAIRISFSVMLPFGGGLVLFGSDILGLFGPEFGAGKTTLTILVLGRISDVALGVGALLLTMTGHERKVAFVFIVMAFVNVLFNAVLIPPYGSEGAAVATVASLVTTKIILYIYALKITHLNVGIFPKITFWSGHQS